MKRSHLILLSTLIAIAVIAVAAWYRITHPPVAATLPATHPATVTATTAVAVKKPKTRGPTTQLLDILRAENPRYPTTQRLDSPLNLKYAAHAVVRDPVYLDLRGNLWITRPDAPAEFDFLKAGQTDTATHLVRDVVRFVLWSTTAPDRRGQRAWLPHLVVDSPAGGFDLLDPTGRRHLPDTLGYRWARAQVLPDPRTGRARIVVPTATGICAFAFDDDPAAIATAHHRLLDPAKHKPDQCAVQTSMDLQGIIAWVTDAAGARGVKGAGVARFAPVPPAANDANPPAYKWTDLTGKTGWPDQVAHMVPLLDGSILQIVTPDTTDPADKDKVTFSMNSLGAAAAAVDQRKIVRLVFDLASPELEKRDKAFAELTQYGPGITPILEKLLEDAAPEARIRIEQLLKSKIEPGLGGMSLVDSRMRIVSRLADGGVIGFAEQGVAIPRDGEEQPQYISPAWLSIRPGYPVHLLAPGLVAELNPDKHKVIAWAQEWIVLDPVLGPQWYLGNRLEPLLKKSEREFTRFAGIDATGRWLFQSPVAAPTPTDSSARPTANTRPSTTTTAPTSRATTATTTASRSTDPARATPAFARTLILDPRLPDTTPRLPGWELPPSAGKVGWDKNHWPVIFIDAKPNPIPWALGETDWRVIDPAKEMVFTEPADVPAPSFPPAPARRRTQATTTTTAPAATRSATTTTSPSAATAPSTSDDEIAALGAPLLVTPDGVRYYGGAQSLRILGPAGELITWPLPEKAVGSAAKPALLRTSDGLLFLFNEPGRIVRLRENRPDPDTAAPPDEPVTFEAAFGRHVPTDPAPLRIWLDPAERICIAHGGSRVTVLFPTGRIPRSIAEKMPAQDSAADE